MKKKFLLAFLAAGLTLCAVGCGGDDKPTSVAGPKDTALKAWAVTEEQSFEIGTDYEVPNAIVKDSEGKEFVPAFTVYDFVAKARLICCAVMTLIWLSVLEQPFTQ